MLFIPANFKEKFFYTFILCSLYTSTFAQNGKILFTVNGQPTYTDEFSYIYGKTNGAKADYSRGSLEEYLDLYTKFKMKVARAREMKLDTLPALKEELNGYRRQLADSYLTDREVGEKLAREAHARMVKDLKISHILFRVDKDTAGPYNRALSVQTRLQKGESFESLVIAESDDTYSKTKGGNIGYVTAMLPEGFYDLETAIYNTPVGKTTGIVRTSMGYHIARVDAQRPARGEIEAAHILKRFKIQEVEQPDAKRIIDSIYTALKGGANFEALAAKYSDDAGTSTHGGYLTPFGIGRYEPPFEDAAFSIEKDGDYTAPFQSSIGWHIIKRIKRTPIEGFDAMKTRLKARIQRDGRYSVAKLALVERIKREAPLFETADALKKYATTLDSSFITYSWKKPEAGDAPMFRFSTEKDITANQFTEYLTRQANNRINYAIQTHNDIPAVTQKLYNDFVNERALAYEELQLDKKYPDFRNLMREYEEGILLFEAMKTNIWDKASLDSVGLEKFYNDNKSKFMWNDRSSMIYYTVADSAKDHEYDEIRKYAGKHTPQEVIKKFNAKKDLVSFREESVERGKGKILGEGMWKQGTLIDNKAGRNFVKVEKVRPPSQKTLKEARGFVVADYQDYLEKQWLQDLTKSYKLQVNRDVFETLVKK